MNELNELHLRGEEISRKLRKEVKMREIVGNYNSWNPFLPLSLSPTPAQVAAIMPAQEPYWPGIRRGL